MVRVALMTTTRGSSECRPDGEAEATRRFVALRGAKQGPQGFVADSQKAGTTLAHSVWCQLAAHVRPFWTAPPSVPFILVPYLSHTSVRCLDLLQNTPADGPCSGLDKRVHVGHAWVGRMAVTTLR